MLHVNGAWADPLPLVKHWLDTHAGTECRTSMPADSASVLPLVLLSRAPGGGADGYTRTQDVDIDLYAATQSAMGALISKVTVALSSLAGNGDETGYADDARLSAFTDMPVGDRTDLLRCTATLSVDMRPQ